MNFLYGLLNILLVVSSVFLILLVLIQRGKGGGLAGAFGGAGGSSAFGTKAGDVFTRITIVVAAIWIVLNMVQVVVANRRHTSALDVDTPAALSKEKPVRPEAPSSSDKPPVRLKTKGESLPSAPEPGQGKGALDQGAPSSPTEKAPSTKESPASETPTATKSK